MPLLSVRNLTTAFRTAYGESRVVDDVSFDLEAGEVLGIVGESGSGKSVTALSIMGLVPTPPGRVAGGEILFAGRDLLALPPAELRSVRGKKIAMIFQEPMTSLNPVFTVGDQIIETLVLHENLTRRQAQDRAIDLINLVGIPSAARRIGEYPHELSGGMRQRVMIAMALACNPQLLIADEPTTALDVTIQAQILDLLRELQSRLGLAVILITHDLGIVAEFANRVMVMYCGRVVETATTRALFGRPLHPYTDGLLRSMPAAHSDADELHAIDGVVPPPHELPKGCHFNPRCPHMREACTNAIPPLVSMTAGHAVACIRHNPYRAGGAGS